MGKTLGVSLNRRSLAESIGMSRLWRRLRLFLSSEAQRREVQRYAAYSLRNGQAVQALFQGFRGLAAGLTPGGPPPGFPGLAAGGGRESGGDPGFRPLEGLRPASGSPPGAPQSRPGSPVPDVPPWRQSFEDPEDIFLAHRFGWIMRSLAGGVSSDELERLLSFACLWVDTHPQGENSPGWDSYSVAERLVHWLFLLSVACAREIGTYPGFSKLLGSLRQQAEFLLHHLEFRGSSTNNHLINDGRALYLTGMCLGEERFAEAGREIVFYGAREMFSPSGFLRESSSHYHLLLCRTFLEVLWAARRFGDSGTFDRLEGRVRAMVDASSFFLSCGDLPLIGDVSPDFTPEFLCGVPAVGRCFWEEEHETPDVLGWHSLFLGAEAGRAQARKAAGPEAPRAEAYSDAGYYRLRAGAWSLFFHVVPLGYVAPWSHGHGDLLGFVLYYKGMPLLVDTGRSTYVDSPLGRYGRDVCSHNSLTVDGIAPCLIHSHNGYCSMLVSDYYARPPRVSVEEGTGEVRAEILCRGFERMQPGLQVRRVFRVSRTEFSVEDHISGKGRHRIEAYFHFDPGVEVVSDDADRLGCVLPDGGRLAVTKDGGDTPIRPFRGVDFPVPLGWHSPRYGEIVPTWTVVVAGRERLPSRRKYVFRPAQGQE